MSTKRNENIAKEVTYNVNVYLKFSTDRSLAWSYQKVIRGKQFEFEK